MKKEPADVWNLRELLTSEAEELGVDDEWEIESHVVDFNFAVMDFWHWLSNMREQKRKATLTSDLKLSDKQYWGARYKNDEEIMEKYGPQWSMSDIQLYTTDEEILDLMDDMGDDFAL